MKILLTTMMLILTVSVSVQAQSKLDQKRIREIVREAVDATPHYEWRQDSIAATWRYGYEKDGKFYYRQSFEPGLSDLRSLEPVNFQRFRRNQPQATPVYQKEVPLLLPPKREPGPFGVLPKREKSLDFLGYPPRHRKIKLNPVWEKKF
jgi:hypothetical protein